PGILAALHTWSQTLVRHPHVHCLVTGGGRTADGSWKAVRTGFLLPVRVVMAGFPGGLLSPRPPAPSRARTALPPAPRPPPPHPRRGSAPPPPGWGTQRRQKGPCPPGSAPGRGRGW